MYLRAKYTKYKMAKTKFSTWRYVICEICKKNGSNRPFLASRVADTIFPPLIEGHHRQLDNQCKDPMDKTKDCRVGQLTKQNPASNSRLNRNFKILTNPCAQSLNKSLALGPNVSSQICNKLLPKLSSASTSVTVREPVKNVLADFVR